MLTVSCDNDHSRMKKRRRYYSIFAIKKTESTLQVTMTVSTQSCGFQNWVNLPYASVTFASLPNRELSTSLIIVSQQEFE